MQYLPDMIPDHSPNHFQRTNVPLAPDRDMQSGTRSWDKPENPPPTSVYDTSRMSNNQYHSTQQLPSNSHKSDKASVDPKQAVVQQPVAVPYSKSSTTETKERRVNQPPEDASANAAGPSDQVAGVKRKRGNSPVRMVQWAHVRQ